MATATADAERLTALLGTWIDYSEGTVSGAAMAAAGITGAIRYVGIGGSAKRLTHAEYADHVAHGRQTIAVVEMGTTDADGGAAKGTVNAKAALADLAVETAGLPPIPCVFMANDQNKSTSTEVAYVRAASAVLTPAGHTVGPYGFGAFLLACAAAGLCPIGWQAGPAPSRTGTAALATFWQRQGGAVKPADGPTSPVNRVVGGVSCDLNNQLKELPDMAVTAADAKTLLQTPLTDGSLTEDPFHILAWLYEVLQGNGGPAIAALAKQITAVQGALSKEEADLLAALQTAGQHVDVSLTDAQVAALSTPIVDKLAALPGAVRQAIGQALVATGSGS